MGAQAHAQASLVASGDDEASITEGDQDSGADSRVGTGIGVAFEVQLSGSLDAERAWNKVWAGPIDAGTVGTQEANMPSALVTGIIDRIETDPLSLQDAIR